VADDLGTQLGIQNEINKVLVAREAIMKRNASLLQGQAQLAKELCNALRCENLDGIEERLQGIRNAMEDAANAAEDAADNFNDVTDEIGKMVDELEDAQSATKSLDSAFDSLDGVAAVFSTIGGSISGAFSAVGKAVTGISSLVSKTFGALIDGAYEAAQAGRSMAEAFEEVRDQFGDLASGEGLAITEAFHDVDKAASEFGVNLGSRFGPFVEGSIAKLKAMAAAIENLGDLGPLLKNQFTGKVAFAMDSLAKGAGLSGEAFQSLANRSLNAGQSLEGVLEQTSRSIASVAKGIGVSTKTLGKSFDAIAKDVTNFGHLTIQEMTSLAAVMTETGISMSTVQGIASKFDQFDSAADSVAKLTQAFGLNLNAVDLLNASDEERLQMLKTSFMEQGKSIDQLSRQERQYLAQSAGIAESDLERVFGDQAGSIDETASAAERAQEAQIGMAASMKEMEKSIKRIFRPLQKFSGFLEAFLEGFNKAFALSGLLAPLQNALVKVEELGNRAGDAFSKFVEDAGGLEAVFDLKAFIAPFRFITKFFEEIAEGKAVTEAFDSMFTNLLLHLETQVTEFVPFANKIIDSILGVLNSPEVQASMRKAFTGLLDTLKRIVDDPVVKQGLQGAALGLVTIFGSSLAFNLLSSLPAMILSGLSMALPMVAKKIGMGGVKKAATKIATKLGGLFVPGPGWIYTAIVAAISGGLAGSDIEERMGAELDAKFSSEMGAVGGKLAASLLNAFTLGLLPDSWLMAVGNFGGNIAQSFSDALDFLGLDTVRDILENGITGLFDTFRGFGDVLKNFFNPGKQADVINGAADFAKGILDVASATIAYFPALIIDIARMGLNGIGSVFTMENAKLVFKGFFTGISNVFSIFLGIILGIGDSLFDGLKINFLKGLNSLIDGVAGIPLVSSLLNKAGIEKFDISKLEKAADAAAIQASNVSQSATATAEAVVAETNETTKAIRAIGKSGTDASVAIDDFIKGTSTGASRITVDREKVQFAINLNVNLVADKLAEALSDRAVVSDEFVLSRSGGGITPGTA
jgi:hypothetical protein